MSCKNIISETRYKDFTINIHYDSDPRSPRDPGQFENLGTIYTSHCNYQPEEDFHKNFEEHEVFHCGEFGQFSRSFLAQYIALPIYLYDHGGYTVNTTDFSCRWDTSRLGIIAVPLGKVREEYGWEKITAKRRQKIESYLRNEVETLDNYLTGSVYGYTITDADGEEVDASWGYYGYESINEMEIECKSIITHYRLNCRKEKIKSLLTRFRREGLQLCIPFSAFPS